MGTDDPILIERFAAEVAPAVGELVEAERSSEPRPQPSAPDVGVGAPVSSRWDETTRPSGPPPPQDHAYSAGASAVGQHLVEVHDMLREELERVRDITQQVLSGALAVGEARSSINEMTMRQNDWTLGAYCAAYCRTVTMHHSMEDAQVFPYLRRSDPGLAPVIDRLAEEHVVIHDVLEELDAALVRFIADPENSRELHEARRRADRHTALASVLRGTRARGTTLATGVLRGSGLIQAPPATEPITITTEPGGTGVLSPSSPRHSSSPT